MKLTRAGNGVLASALAMIVFGRLFGLLEFYVLAAMAAIALGLAIIYGLTRRLRLSITRSTSPSRLRAGNTARIDLRIRNQGQQGTPVMAASDRLPGDRGASVLAAPIPKQSSATVAYQLPTRRRGELLVGPLVLTYSDPLGLTSTKINAAGQTRVIVHAEVVNLKDLTSAPGLEESTEPQPFQALATSGQDFFALRPYIIGDDLRRVSWRASARTEDLVVRQDEQPESGRITVLFDVQSKSYSPEGFERAVSATLSILMAVRHETTNVQFGTTAELTTREVFSQADLRLIDEQLALISPSATASLPKRIDDLCRKGRGTMGIVITGSVDETTGRALAYGRQRLSQCLAISCEPRSDLTGPLVGVYDGTTDLATVWNQLLPQAAHL